MDREYNYVYTDGSTVDPAVSAALIGTIILFALVFALIAYAVSAWLLGRIFKKAGVPQWAAWVPIYNTWKILEIGGQQGFWAVLALLPVVQIISAVFIYIAMYRIGKNLGKEDWFVLLAIFVPIIWMGWLAFDDSKWPTDKTKKLPADQKTA